MERARSVAWPAAVLAVTAACGDASEVPGGAGPVIATDLWTVEAADDPFWSETLSEDIRPCTPQDWRAEPNGIEVQTTNCNYITLTQPLLQPLRAGQGLRVQLWWQTLASVEPAEGRIAVWVGDWRFFDERVPIPSEADARTLSRSSPRSFADGTPVYFHVDNHGFNSWTLGSLIAERGEDG